MSATSGTYVSTNPISDCPQVGPYMGVQRDEQRKVGKKRVRLVLYAAYNAYGLIGSECNGIAILDEDEMAVVCDEIAKTDSGYFGATPAQAAWFDALMGMSAQEFRAFVNQHPRSRYTL
jgi:hypothetical protein